MFEIHLPFSVHTNMHLRGLNVAILNENKTLAKMSPLTVSGNDLVIASIAKSYPIQHIVEFVATCFKQLSSLYAENDQSALRANS